MDSLIDDILTNIILLALDYRSQVLLLRTLTNVTCINKHFYSLTSNSNRRLWVEIYRCINLEYRDQLICRSQLLRLFRESDKRACWKTYVIGYISGCGYMSNVETSRIRKCDLCVPYFSGNYMMFIDNETAHVFDVNTDTFHEMHIQLPKKYKIHRIYDTACGLIADLKMIGNAHQSCICKLTFNQSMIYSEVITHHINMDFHRITYNGIFFMSKPSYAGTENPLIINTNVLRHPSDKLDISASVFVPFINCSKLVYSSVGAWSMIDSGTRNVYVVFRYVHSIIDIYTDVAFVASIGCDSPSDVTCYEGRFLVIRDKIYDLLTGKLLYWSPKVINHVSACSDLFVLYYG